MARAFSIFCWLLLALCACQGGAQPASQTSSRGGSSPATASADGMCQEHGVLEAVCTKCNPALVAVFRAKGDFCEEHGFPESFCPLCHPERGGRPAADLAAADGEGPADGVKIRFRSKETARLAGLRMVPALERATSREVSATARVAYDATRVAQINPRMPGVVLSIAADVGARVKAGQALAVIESAGVGAEQSRLQAAETRVEVAEANLRRVESLRGEGISPEREVLEARREREEARADVRAARSALGMVGARADGSAQYTLKSPLAGIVTQRTATIGRLVDGDDILFEIVDPSAMWIELEVPEGELSLIAIGQTAVVTLDGVPEREFSGPVSFLSPAVDPRTRTALARVPLANADGVLRANLFGRGRIAVTDPRAAVLVPRAAVQRARSVSLVFVRTAEDTFEGRRVKVGAGSGELVSVAGRVKPGDEIVTEGSFLLKTETLKDSIGAGCCEVD